MDYFEFARAKHKAMKPRWKSKWGIDLQLTIEPIGNVNTTFYAPFPYVEAGIISGEGDIWDHVYSLWWRDPEVKCGPQEFKFSNVYRYPLHSVKEQTSIYAICSDNKPYVDFLPKFINHYKDFKEIIIVMYSDSDYFKTDHPRVKMINTRYPLNMAEARNIGLKACTSEFVLPMDIDTFLSEEDIAKIQNEWINNNHMGVLNLRQHPSIGRQGNSIFFSRRIETPYWNEEFKGFFSEDVEYMLTFSKEYFRAPRIVYLHYDKVKHKPLPNSQGNNELFDRIAKDGRLR